MRLPGDRKSCCVQRRNATYGLREVQPWPTEVSCPKKGHFWAVSQTAAVSEQRGTDQDRSRGQQCRPVPERCVKPESRFASSAKTSEISHTQFDSQTQIHSAVDVWLPAGEVVIPSPRADGDPARRAGSFLVVPSGM